MRLLRSNRSRLPILWALMLGVIHVSSGEGADVEHLIYVGTYTGKGSEGIYCYRFNQETGELISLGLAARTENPSYLVSDPEGRFLYAVNELDTFNSQPTGAVSVFSIQRGSGSLELIDQVSSLGSGPAHLSLDRSARYILVANYGGGNVTVFPIGPDGRLGHHTAFMQARGSSVNMKRQAGPHAHSIQVTTDNRLALVADLGIDRLLVYDFDERTGSLTADSLKFQRLQPGSGPRHVAIAPSGKFVYVVNELTSSVTGFSYNPAQMSLAEMQTLSTLPADFTGTNYAAEIIVDSQGTSLYVSNRGDDSIVVFRIDSADGKLTPVQRVPCGGRSPRNIALDPSGRWLLSANQRSDRINVFRVDSGDGRLTATSRVVDVASPVCVTFVPHR